LRAVLGTVSSILKDPGVERSSCGSEQGIIVKGTLVSVRGQQSAEADDTRPGFGSFEFSNSFNEQQADYIFGLQNQFGHGFWVNSLGQQADEAPTLSDEYLSMKEADVTGNLKPEISTQQAPAVTRSSSPYPQYLNQGESMSSVERVSSAHETTLNSLSIATVYGTLPLHVPPITRMDETLYRITPAGRQWAHQQGRQHGELSQPSFPSILSLLNPEIDDEDEITHPIAAGLASHSLTMIVKSFSTKVTFYCMLAHLIRWFVNPYKYNYNHLPTYLRSTRLQMTILSCMGRYRCLVRILLYKYINLIAYILCRPEARD
jgi:hypothetical protein